MENLSKYIKDYALKLGFHACGIAKAEFLVEEARYLKKWLQDGCHGKMAYMENHFGKRTDPRQLFENARSVIVVLYNYYPQTTIPGKNNYKISKYAYGTDYHFVLKKKLKELIEFIKTQKGNTHARAFVDSAPVLERSWAEKAGLGWIGKNTCLITKKQGSYFFIGEIITDLELDYDNETVPNHCGGCTRCLDACPTQALDNNGLDARKCISYLTIEFRGDQLPVKTEQNMEDWIFGCDICQDVCPWNRLSEPHNQPEFDPPEELREMTKDKWGNLDESQFRVLFKNSPVKRTKYRGLKRNITFVGGNQEKE